MKKDLQNSLLIASALSIPLFSSIAHAQNEVATDPVGFVKVAVPAQSDAVLAVPFYRESIFKGVIQSITGNQIKLASTPTWTPNQFTFALGSQNNTYSALIATGPKEGMLVKIVSNTADTLTVTLEAGDNLSGILAADTAGAQGGDHIDIIPHWTPTSLLSTTPATGTQLLIKPTNSPGINLSSQTTLVYGVNAWFQSSANADHFPLSFGQSFILRNNSASPLEIAFAGNVPMTKYRALVKTFSSANRQDLSFGYSSPVPQTVGSINLGFTAGDQLIVYNNAASGKNKSAAQTLVFTGTTWFLGGIDVGATFFLQPGNGYVFRKNNTSLIDQTIVWESLQSYLD